MSRSIHFRNSRRRVMSRLAYLKILPLLFVLLSFFPDASAQKRKPAIPDTGHGRSVLWERVNVEKRDLFYGPGGEAMVPDLSRVKFEKEETGGHNKKYKIVDGSGRKWVAKLGSEARPETAAVR